jgi:hypothetical protein
VREHAVPAPARADDLDVDGDLGEALGELGEGDRARASQVAGRELLGRVHVEHHTTSPASRLRATRLLVVF